MSNVSYGKSLEFINKTGAPICSRANEMHLGAAAIEDMDGVIESKHFFGVRRMDVARIDDNPGIERHAEFPAKLLAVGRIEPRTQQSCVYPRLQQMYRRVGRDEWTPRVDDDRGSDSTGDEISLVERM